MTIAVFDKDKKNNIRQSNFLIEARYKLTTQEMRIVNILKAMVSESNEYQINLKDISRIIESRSDSLIPDLRRAADGLLKKPIKIHQGDTIIQMNWISSFTYTKGNTFVTFAIDPRIKPYFLSIKSNYTDFELTELLSFKSFYSSRIYELAKQYYPNIPKRSFDVEELKSILGCEESYPHYSNFRDKVLDPAVLEITNNPKLSLNVGFKDEKMGKKVKWIHFYFSGKVINSEKVIESSEKVIDGNPNEMIASEAKKGELQKLDSLEILFEEAFKKYNIGKKIKVFPYNKLKSKFKICLSAFESAEAFLKQIDDYNNYLEVASWRERKAFSAWINDPECYGNDWIAKKEEELKKQQEQLKTTSQKREDFEFRKPVPNITKPSKDEREIEDLISKIKFQLGNAGKPAAWQHFVNCSFDKLDNGWKVVVTDSKALQYQDLLSRINIKIEIK